MLEAAGRTWEAAELAQYRVGGEVDRYTPGSLSRSPGHCWTRFYAPHRQSSRGDGAVGGICVIKKRTCFVVTIWLLLFSHNQTSQGKKSRRRWLLAPPTHVSDFSDPCPRRWRRPPCAAGKRAGRRGGSAGTA